MPPEPSSATPLSPTDLSISTALSAWLSSLSLSPPSLPLPEAAHHCISLCQLFSAVAPHFLSNRDYFIPSNVQAAIASRQRRYNTRQLARSLADWFGLRSRSPSPLQDANSNKLINPPVQLQTQIAESLLHLLDTARQDYVEDHAVLLRLAEIVLCAAVHSDKKDAYIQAVMTLTPVQQDALALSIRRTSVVENEGPVSGVLMPVTVADENAVLANTTKSPRTLKEDAALGLPRGIPLADYKALAAERDGLRRKLACAEAEKNRCAEESDVLRASLDESGDRIQELAKVVEEKDREIAGKARSLVQAKENLRTANVGAEELDVLRAKAAGAEQLEASLKRASKRLEEVGQMRMAFKELEAQIEAYRENEDRLGRHSDYLEAQLKSSNEKAHTLVDLSEGMSKGLEEKELENQALEKENKNLNEKLDNANRQLESMLVQSCGAHSSGDVTTQTAPSMHKLPIMRSTDKLNQPNILPEKDEAVVSAAVVESSIEAPPFDETIVSNHLFNEIGIRMTWEDIVQCIRGVMDALRDMDELDGQENTSDVTYMQDNTNIVSTDGGCYIESNKSRISSQSGRSVESAADMGSDTESRVSVLPAFGILDSKLAEQWGNGDEFDFAANEINVCEIPADEANQGMDRRRSSQLRTIPENREGFQTEESYDGEGSSSYCSGYTTDDMSESVDATVDTRSRATTTGKVLRTSQNNGTSTLSDSPMLADNEKTADLVDQSVNQVRPTLPNSDRPRQLGYNSLPSNVRRAASLTVSVLSGMRRTPSHSETRMLMRQARAELHALQQAMEAMRMDRQASTSISVLVSQLNDVREDLRVAQSVAVQKEAESNGIRKELNILLKEYDSLSMEKKLAEEREESILQEKERLVQHLKESLATKEAELKEAKEDTSLARKQLDALHLSKSTAEEQLHAAEVIARAQEVELARLNARMEASEVITSRLSAVVNKTDGFSTQMSRQRESHINDIAEATRREKQLAEEARDEARRVAKSHAKVLDDVRATAAAAAIAGHKSRDMEKMFPSRKNTRFSDFWRKLLHREKQTIDFTMPPSGLPIPTARCHVKDSSRKSEADRKSGG